MWQLYSSIGLLFGAAEETIDKATMVGSKTIDLLSAAWIRNTISFGVSIVAIVVVTGTSPQVVFSLPIIFFGILNGMSAITYTILLKKVEITASSIMTSFIPLFFLPIDLFIFDAHFLPRQVFGIVILVTGGIIFFYRKASGTPITRKQMVTLISIFLFDALLIGFESYLFKDYFVSLHLSEMSFLVNIFGATFLFLTILVSLRCLYVGKMPAMRIYKKYMRGSLFSKILDYGNSFFFLKALTLASAAQVTSMKVFYPIALLFIVIGTQKRFGVDLEEYLDRRSLVSKTLGIVIICCGAYLAR